MSKFYGSSITEDKPDIDYDPSRGYTVVRQFRGTYDDLRSMASIYEFQGYRVEHRPGQTGGYGTLRVYMSALSDWPADKPLLEKWNTDANSLEKTLWQHPDVVAQTSKVSDPAGIVLLRADIEAYLGGTITTHEIVWSGTPATRKEGKEIPLTLSLILDNVASAGMDRTVFEKFILELARGQDSFVLPQKVIKRTVVVRSDSTLIEQDENLVGRIFTSDGLIARYQIPTTRKFKVTPNYFWLFHSVVVDDIAADKVQMDYEFWGAPAYSTFAYGQPVQ
ncbi:MAG: hypothetical protein ABS95_01090 [Verrucomicrobia bacterium SCN 57-15]|nr:MAG: hypothetical protein ABS95_01090 [Verrucomicrobia bacterium SCN 57-15]